jgi:hypothetical protein
VGIGERFRVGKTGRVRFGGRVKGRRGDRVRGGEKGSKG